MPRYSLGGGGDAAITAINNAAENLIVTVGSTTTELEAEATLTFASNKMIPTASAHNAAGTALAVSAGATTAGTTDNIAGGALTIQGGQGKGSGAGGDIIFQTANAGGSGSTINALATALTLSDDLSAAFTGAITGTTIDASTDFTIGDTVITDGVITDSSGLQLVANLDINGTADISGDLTLSAGADGALVFSNAGENSIKIPDNQGSALIIEEADNAYITFTTTNSSEAITVAKATTFSDDITTAATKDINLGDGGNVNITAPLLATADHTYSGTTAQMLAGGAIAAFDLVCIHTTTQEVVEADASAVATARVIGIAPAAISDTATGTVLLHGFIRDASWSWTTGGVLFLSEIAGAMTHTAPTTAGAFVQAVGIALSPTVVFINPSLDIIEHA